MSVLAIDHGTSKCGLAIEVAGIALPLETVATNAIVSKLKSIVAERKVETIVIGIAKHLDGRNSRQSAIQKNFSRQIASQFPGCEIILWDERLTTSEARLSLEEAGFDGSGGLDDIAASILLQSYLDARK